MSNADGSPLTWTYEDQKNSETINRLEKENKLMREALDWIMPKVHQAYHEGELEKCEKGTCHEYLRVLAKLGVKK